MADRLVMASLGYHVDKVQKGDTMKKIFMLLLLFSCITAGGEKEKLAVGQVWLQPKLDPFSPGVQLTIVMQIKENAEGEDWVLYKFRYSDSDYAGFMTMPASMFMKKATLLRKASKHDTTYFKIDTAKVKEAKK